MCWRRLFNLTFYPRGNSLRKNTKAKRKSNVIDATNDISPPEIGHLYRNRLKPRSENQKNYIRTIAENTITFCQGSAGTGKALTLDSVLFTKNGPITMGDVKLNDKIANPDGGFSKVTAIYPQGLKQVFRVYFSNQTYVDCCEDHLWQIKQDNKTAEFVVNTKYLIDHCRRYDGKRILSIPCTKPVNFDRKNYKIDPYLLGIIISEGNCTNGNVVFTSCESEVLDKVNSLLDNNYIIKTKDSIDHRIVKKNRSPLPNIYKEELKALELWGKYSYEKYIPNVYKYGSIDQRISLLQGLMDGDGTVTKNGSSSYCTTSYCLAKDLCELVYSLGGTTKIKTKLGSPKINGTRYRNSYILHLSLPNDIRMFLLNRKQKRVVARTKYFPKLYIDKVEKLDQKLMQCITVDHKNSLYLTNNYIPTHNTHISVGMGLEYLIEEKVKKIIITRPVVESGEKIGYLPGPQPMDAKILTPSGWVLMGDIKIGYMVISRDGLATKVLGVFPKGIKPVYKITTTDGRTTECCSDHLWLTQTAADRKRKREGSVKTTKEISLSLLNDKNKINHFLPRNEPVHFAQQELPMSAYSLGVLLGDGSLSNSITFSNTDNELIARVNEEMALIGCYCVKQSLDRISYNIRSNLHSKKTAKQVCMTNSNTGEITKYSSVGIASRNLAINNNTLQARCRRLSSVGDVQYSFEKLNKTYTNPAKEIIYNLGILGTKAINKSIPNIYKYSSITDRLELLRGLMDTDGSVKESTGEASFCTISKQLAQDVIELVQSLGGKARLISRNRVGKTNILKKSNRVIISRHISYQFNITLPNNMNPFYISRKAKKYKNNFMQGIGISEIVEVGAKPVQCIRVEHPEHLYITDNYLVTHNTAEEKLHPYLLPILDEVCHFIPMSQYASLKLNNRIEIVPLGLMRGRNFHNSFIIADECQNASYDQLKMLLTRTGMDSKMVLTGDVTQSDLQKHMRGGFIDLMKVLTGLEGVGTSYLDNTDIVRNPIIASMLYRLENFENEISK